MCDQSDHCPDGSDEISCEPACNLNSDDCLISRSNQRKAAECICASGYFQCKSGGCLSYAKVCDEMAGCNDMSDEINCGHVAARMKFKTYKNNSVVEPCPSGYSSCGRRDDNCFRNDMVCVHHIYHLYRSSEACESTRHLYNCTHHVCPHQYKCADDFCVPTHFVCDGITDCPEGDDEEDCKQLSCPGLLKCSQDNLCVHPYYIYDGNVQCLLSQDDERIIDLVNLPQCSNVGFTVQCIKVNITLQNILDLSLKLQYLQLVSVTLQYHDAMFQHFIIIYLLNLTSTLLQAGLTSSLFQGLTTLRTLILKNAGIRSIESNAFVDLTVLELLDLQDNYLQVINPLTFNGIHTLDNLDLSMLHIEELQSCTFCVVHAIDYLDVSMNDLTVLHAFSFAGVSISNLNITGK